MRHAVEESVGAGENQQAGETPQANAATRASETRQANTATRAGKTPQASAATRASETPQANAAMRAGETQQASAATRAGETPQANAAARASQTPQAGAATRVGDAAQASVRGGDVEPTKVVSPPTRHRARRRLIDYPRRGKKGLRRWLPSWRLWLGLLFTLVALVVGAFFVALAMVQIPQANDFATRQATVFDFADGRTQIAHIGVNRVSVQLNQIPPVVQHAVLAAEDRSFYSESGVSPTGILRAVRNDLTSDSGSLQGGSTITQQYVKNYYLSERQTISRKLDEALVAIKIDQQLPKDTILQNYLNTIYFARGAYGIETAARAYFGVDVWTLADDPAKAAYLAALVQSPYYFGTADTDPAAKQALSQRWAYVLDGMVTEHWLSKQVRDTLTFPATVAQNTNDLAGSNGYLVNAAIAYLDQAHQQDPSVPDSTVVSRGGYTVVTTFQQDYLNLANDVVNTNFSSLDPQHNPADQNVHVGLVALDSTTGAVLGFYGGADYVKRGYNDATQAGGPTGSAIGTVLAGGVDANPRSNWPSAIADLGKLGIQDVNAKDVPPSDDDLTATPLRAAEAYQAALNHGIAYQPYSVAEVLYNGNVVWRANPSAQGFPNSGGRGATGGLFTTGVDGSLQWAWSVGGIGHIAIAVDTYATKSNGTTNRVLTGMSPMAGAEPSGGQTVAEQRTAAMWIQYFQRVLQKTPGLLAGGYKPPVVATTTDAPVASTTTRRVDPTAQKQTSSTTHQQPVAPTTTTPDTTETTTTTTTPPDLKRTPSKPQFPPGSSCCPSQSG